MKTIKVMEAVLQQKAYQVWHEGMLSRIPYEGYSKDDLPVYYAESPSQAKTICCEVDNYLIDGEHHKFTDLRVRRYKPCDKMLFEGHILTRNQIEYELEVRQRNAELDQLLTDNPDSMAYILKGGYYYRPNCAGYTDRKSRAGVYTLERAIKEVKGCSLGDNMRAIVIDKDEHNEMLRKEIEDLQTRLIE